MPRTRREVRSSGVWWYSKTESKANLSGKYFLAVVEKMQYKIIELILDKTTESLTEAEIKLRELHRLLKARQTLIEKKETQRWEHLNKAH
jgi:hypothetical protein